MRDRGEGRSMRGGWEAADWLLGEEVSFLDASVNNNGAGQHKTRETHKPNNGSLSFLASHVEWGMGYCCLVAQLPLLATHVQLETIGFLVST